MKILNLYCGIGGNRKLWGDEHKITAVEIDETIAAVYKDLYPNDNVITADAHEYLRQHFQEFDFIWASPPCPTHSRMQFCLNAVNKPYPDMTLYQEIILLKTFFKGKWVIENVVPYYKPLIEPTFQIDRHYFWSSNFIMSPIFQGYFVHIMNNIKSMEQAYGFDLSKYKINKQKVLRNCVKPEIGKYIFEQIMKVNC